MAKPNIINDTRIYTKKTKGGNLLTVRGSLNDKVKALLEKSKEYTGDKIPSFICE